MLPSVVVVVVNWNGASLLGPCLDSVSVVRYDGPVELVVIDNGSSDGSLDLLRRHYPEVRLIVNSRNNYADANNLAVLQAPSELVLQLNSDARLDRDCLQTLASTLRLSRV